MKKYFITILLLLVLFPFRVDAAEIQKIAINNAPTEAKIGDSITITVPVSIMGVDTGNRDGLGIFYVGFYIEYNENDLIYTNISSNDLESEMYEDNDTKETYVIGMLSEPVTSTNKCKDNVLFCGSYSVTIEFYVKNTNASKTTIKVKTPEAGLFELITEGEANYDAEDMIVIEGSQTASRDINIIKTEAPVAKEPESNINNQKPSTTTPPTTNLKSSNNYPSVIKIENYNIDYNKFDNDYVITVEENINELKLKVELENAKATYEVTGANDLKASNYKVHVIVTAENGEKNTYNINVRTPGTKDVVTDKTEQVSANKMKFKVTKKQMIIIGGVAAGIVVIVLIGLIITKFSNKKIDKALDDL